MRYRILIAEDDATMASLLSQLARKAGFSIEHYSDGESAWSAMQKDPADALLADIQMPGINGLELIEKVSAIYPGLPAVVITGFATVPDVQRAFRAGAMDLITKPFDNDDVRQVLDRISRHLDRERRIESLQHRLLMQEDDSSKPVFNSRAMLQVMELIDKVADLDTPILLTGETGTGKGVIARTIHRNSSRSEGAWFSVNCGAVAETVAESELFGHERGAFTGAEVRKRGILELAHGGTLFLDEINSAPPSIQTRLLDFVQDKTIRRVGGQEAIEVDTRLIIASNQDLAELVKQGDFREDLWYRLNVFPLILPPLRERHEDIIPLIEHFILAAARQFKRPIPRMTEEAEQILLNYGWPGNVRQLENIILRAMVLADDATIQPQHLPSECQNSIENPKSWDWSPDASLKEIEALWIRHMIDRYNGNKSKAARQLGIDVSTLHRKLRN